MKGSGVILFVLVALWVVALLPALLRRHDEATESRSVDRFSLAMRILSRRTPELPERRYVVMPARPASARRPLVMTTREAPAKRWRLTRLAASSAAPSDAAAQARRRPAPERRAPASRPAPATKRHQPAARRPRGRNALAVRRRRLLLALCVLLVAAFGGALALGGMWWGVASFIAVLVLGYLIHLRAEARRRAALARRRSRRPVTTSGAARARARGRVPATATGAHAAEVPSGDWLSPAEVESEQVVGATESAEWAAGSVDASWDPVDVPLPTYVTKPAAPKRVALDPPGKWNDTLFDQDDVADEAPGDGAAMVAEGDELDEIIERRRAVGD